MAEIKRPVSALRYESGDYALLDGNGEWIASGIGTRSEAGEIVAALNATPAQTPAADLGRVAYEAAESHEPKERWENLADEDRRMWATAEAAVRAQAPSPQPDLPPDLLRDCLRVVAWIDPWSISHALRFPASIGAPHAELYAAGVEIQERARAALRMMDEGARVLHSIRCPANLSDAVMARGAKPGPCTCGTPQPAPDAAAAGALTLRPEVAAFAQAMEAQLRANDHKGGWDGMSPHSLFARLLEESGELLAVVDEWDGIHGKPILREAADVANYAMMVADVCGGLATPAPAPTAPTASCVHCGGLMVAALHCTRCGEAEVSGPALVAAEAPAEAAQPAPDAAAVEDLARVLDEADAACIRAQSTADTLYVTVPWDEKTESIRERRRAMARAAIASIGGRAVALRGAAQALLAAQRVGAHDAYDRATEDLIDVLALTPSQAGEAVTDMAHAAAEVYDAWVGWFAEGKPMQCGAAMERLNDAAKVLTARGGGR